LSDLRAHTLMFASHLLSPSMLVDTNRVSAALP
jgi:hypothetical protein